MNRPYIDWQFFRDIPIKEVAEGLGIDINKDNNFLCIAHNDSKPSAHIFAKNNSWHCFACGAGGSCLDLVMYNNGCNIFEAAKFLNTLYPGGIEYHNNQDENAMGIEIPYIPNDLIKEIGLTSNPFNMRKISIPYTNENGNKKPIRNRNDFSIDYISATEIIIHKLLEKQDYWREYKQNVLKNFPEIAYNEQYADVNKYICDTCNKKIDLYNAYIDVLRDFEREYNDLYTNRQTALPWDNILPEAVSKEADEERER